MKKRFTVLVCALCLYTGLCLPAAAAGGYSDVPDSAWYATAVAEVTEKGYMNGVGYGLFQPDTAVSRASVVTTLWRLEGAPAAEGAPPFQDTAGGTWYSEALVWAGQAGIAAGDNKGLFHPDNPVTRQELAVFLQRYAEYQGWDEAYGTLELYSDANLVSDWAISGVRYAIGTGLLQGSGGKLSPGGAATRAQLAVILQRLTTPAMG